MAIIDLFKVQVGKENVWGTPVTPTSKLMGITDITLTPVVEGEQHPDIRGSIAPAYISTVNKVGAEGSIEGLVTYEDIPYFLDSVFGEATPSGSSTYTYNYSAPTTSSPAVRKLTFAYGDGTNDYWMSGGVVSEFSVKGENNSALTFSADLVGKQVTASGLASLNDRAVNVVMGNDVALYIDNFGATVGTTVVNATAFNFELTVTTNREPVYHLGSKTPDTYKEAKWEGELKLSLELNTTSKAYLDSLIAGSSVLKKLIRIKATSGSNIFQMDFAGSALESPELFEDEDGVVTVELTLTGEVDTGSFANWCKMQVVNTVSSLA